MKVKSAVFGSMQNNCYLIVDEKTNKSALVDCSEYNADMIELIGDTGLEYILLTHGHFDHIGGVAEVKEKFNCKVVISKQDAQMLSSSKLSLAAFCGAVHTDCNADIIVEDNSIIMLGETPIKVVATPGHTKGGVCYIAGNNMFTGDTLFFCSCGRTDFPGGSSAELMQSLKRLSAFEGDYNVYPGHDRISSLDYERKYNPYMR